MVEFTRVEGIVRVAISHGAIAWMKMETRCVGSARAWMNTLCLGRLSPSLSKTAHAYIVFCKKTLDLIMGRLPRGRSRSDWYAMGNDGNIRNQTRTVKNKAGMPPSQSLILNTDGGIVQIIG